MSFFKPKFDYDPDLSPFDRPPWERQNSEVIDAKAKRLEGRLETILFHRDGFLIGRLNCGDQVTVIKGPMLSPQAGFQYEVFGKFNKHPKFGMQFAFETYSSKLPTSAEAIRIYIDKHAKWVGPAVSRAIVTRYGDDTLAALKDKPEDVAEHIVGITLERALKISQDLKANAASEKSELDIREALLGISINQRTLSALIKRYGSDAPTVIVSTPYRLAKEIDGISFPIADRIALKHGIKEDSPERIVAGIRHVLEEASFSEGHTYLPRLELTSTARELLDVNRKTIEAVLQAATMADGRLDLDPGIVAIQEERTNDVALADLYEDERLIADRLLALNAAASPVEAGDLTSLAEDQIDAIEIALKTGVFVLYGVPGTGKTSTIARLIQTFPSADVALCAPSGKAARRISELTGHPATTIHSLLEAKPLGDGGFIFDRNEEMPLPQTLIVVDEVSMVSVDVMAALLRAVQDGTHLVLIGDSYQLPSVGAGNVLKDLLASELIAAKELTTIKRQRPGLIIRSCAAIKNGEEPTFKPKEQERKDLVFVNVEGQLACQERIVELASDYAVAVKDPLRDVQVLTALREKTELSVKSLNFALRLKLNAANRPFGKAEEPYWIGDKVIQRRNDYNLDIMNGDIGFVEAVNKKEGNLAVRFDDPPRHVTISIEGNKLELAYAITVHSFQGSQAPIVILAVHSCLGQMVPTRPWLYTGISRAQKLAVLVGERDVLFKVICRNRSAARWTKLRKFLLEINDRRRIMTLLDVAGPVEFDELGSIEEEIPELEECEA